MKLIDVHTASQLIDIPADWIRGMVEQDKLSTHTDDQGRLLVDQDEITARHFVAEDLSAPSDEHIISMYFKITGKHLAL
jgi:hypothetical protein